MVNGACSENPVCFWELSLVGPFNVLLHFSTFFHFQERIQSAQNTREKSERQVPFHLIVIHITIKRNQIIDLCIREQCTGPLFQSI